MPSAGEFLMRRTLGQAIGEWLEQIGQRLALRLLLRASRIMLTALVSVDDGH